MIGVYQGRKCYQYPVVEGGGAASPPSASTSESSNRYFNKTSNEEEFTDKPMTVTRRNPLRKYSTVVHSAHASGNPAIINKNIRNKMAKRKHHGNFNSSLGRYTTRDIFVSSGNRCILE
jgi:hypothetical protein